MNEYMVIVIWNDGRENRMRVPGDNYADAASRCSWLMELSSNITKAEIYQVPARVVGIDVGGRTVALASRS